MQDAGLVRSKYESFDIAGLPGESCTLATGRGFLRRQMMILSVLFSVAKVTNSLEENFCGEL